MSIVYFAGRKGCGKSTLADMLVSQGYIRASFADWLKEVSAKVFNLNLADMYSPIEKERAFSTPLLWNESVANRLATLAGYNTWLAHPKEKYLANIREVLQFIGTDILRKCCSDIHVTRTMANLKPDINYVFDDVRFINELAALKSIGAEGYFIYRPWHADFSNHASEVSLQRTDFDYIIINNGFTSESLIHAFEKRITYSPNNFYNKLLYKSNESAYLAGFFTKLATFNLNLGFETSLTYEKVGILLNVCDLLKRFDDSKFIIKYKNGMVTLDIYDDEIVEDLKLWELTYKHRPSTTPSFIADYPQFCNKWWQGYNLESLV